MLCAIDGEAVPLDDEEDDDPPVRAVIAAGACDPPVTRGVRSIFELAQGPSKGLRLLAGFVCQVNEPAARIRQSLRVAGTTRCTGTAYPSRWTLEDEERERRRRAKQRPPRPPRRAKTKGKKLLQLAPLWDE
jgi:hypothetical protein